MFRPSSLSFKLRHRYASNLSHFAQQQQQQAFCTNSASVFLHQPRLLNSFATLSNGQRACNGVHREYSSASSFSPSGSSSLYLEEIEMDWKKDPNSVPQSWREYFETGKVPQFKIMRRVKGGQGSAGESMGTISGTNAKVVESAIYLIDAYQTFGHRLADLDPLGISDADLDPSIPKELQLETYNLSDHELDQEFSLHGGKGLFLSSRTTTLRKLVNDLKAIYCGKIGWEFMHVPSMEQRDWLRQKIENMQKLDAAEKKLTLERLMFSDNFEAFCSTKWPTTKRFGLEGCESLIPGIKTLIDSSAMLGMESVVVGMAHRGRLNVLANVVRKPMENIFHEFITASKPNYGSGDVKYHLGLSIKRTLSGINKRMHISLLANPSHLEAVNPLVEGKTRAKQLFMHDKERKKVMSILLHGDAAFAGQGVVYETMGFSGIQDYTTGGTIHIIINNQIGFTTNPAQGRSSPYCSDLAKFIGAPVFHVNADEPEAVIQVSRLAAEFRQEFGMDVVIDLVGYRKRGHNEIDQPKFTQPIMYKAIDNHPPVLKLYSSKLLQEGTISKDEYNKMVSSIHSTLEEAFESAREGRLKKDSSDWFAEDSEWKGIKGPVEFSPIRKTGVSADTIRQVGELISTYPKDFNIHPVMKRIMADRNKRVQEGKRFDWGIAENLAYGSLLAEGSVVRISGQDVQRGTFSHRHGVIFDQTTGNSFFQLRSLEKEPGFYMISNSPLSEYGVLGFETGFSYESPRSLVVFECQFGDFCNTAQVIFDQFLSSGEQKWLRSSGLVVLLPHGYDGQGPEHSNSRMERLLQLSDEDPDVYPEMGEGARRQIQDSNWQVVNCSTPANIFHALRRQMHRSFRKPLMVVSPKYLLRHKLCVSDIEEFTEGTEFVRAYPDPNPDQLVPDDQVKRVLFCSGQVYYDLWEYRQNNNINDVVIVRVEQLAPFPFDIVGEQLMKYRNADIKWVQEEPKNYGAWNHFFFRARTALRHHSNGQDARSIDVFARKTSASPATGYKQIHDQEQRELVEQSFTL
eukprot:CAMPEP_0117441216 /NCGR_PEP_ID=MMETSP0759-20121206/3521_1 /TAXON_ID=63605 /ORGANISM="Percolomonas cosmopolitus, Strain WS" /LENGTH=1024 /DNA_ID=CAMNT_0005233065 /DNA_START=458 /DNA_END=3532 /DNA_ORIENTATION=-